jgi:hypothetical protein
MLVYQKSYMVKSMKHKVEQNISLSSLEEITNQVKNLEIEDAESNNDEEATIQKVFKETQLILESLQQLVSKTES